MKKKEKSLTVRIAEAQDASHDVPLFVLDLIDDLAYRIRQLEEAMAAGRNLVLDEAIKICERRAEAARKAAEEMKAAWQDWDDINMFYADAAEAQACANTIVGLKK